MDLQACQTLTTGLSAAKKEAWFWIYLDIVKVFTRISLRPHTPRRRGMF